MDATELLLSRSSALRLEMPAPNPDELEIMLLAALRAPDHGRLRPWKLVLVNEDKLGAFGDLLAQSLKQGKPDASAEMLQRERDKARRAPLIIVVAAQIHNAHKIPEVEQLLSAAAAAQNIMLAAHARGYGAMWKTGAPAYDAKVKAALGLSETDAIVGFMYIGTRVGGEIQGSRPEIFEIASVWAG
jgi:nitroreductase